jgi:hypothetical protein
MDLKKKKKKKKKTANPTQSPAAHPCFRPTLAHQRPFPSSLTDMPAPPVSAISYLQHPFPLSCSVNRAAPPAVSRAVCLPPSFKTSINAR